MPKKVCILGAGGHYIYSFGEFIEHNQNDFWVYLLPADFGGSSGLWNRLLEFNNGELNQKLHGKIIPNLTWGDINKTIIFYLNQKAGQEISSTLDFRSNDLAKLINEFDILGNYLGLDKLLEEQFYSYLITCYDYFCKHQSELKFATLKPLCLGYIWQTFLYNELNLDGEKLNQFYQDLMILPKNLHLNFTYSNRQTLLGTDIKKQDLVGEDQIDLHLNPILPESLKLQNIDKSDNVFTTSFLENLKSSQVVIIPPGSIANWLPLINYPEVEKILQVKSNNNNLIWVTNPFFKPNEFETNKYLNYLKTKKILPTLLLPTNLNEELTNINILDTKNTENLITKKSLELDTNQKIYAPSSLKAVLNSILV